MISANLYLDSLQTAVSELPAIFNILDQIDDSLYEEYVEQFKWMLEARFIFLSQTSNLSFYLNKIMSLTHKILFHKEKLFHYMDITEQDIICVNF